MFLFCSIPEFPENKTRKAFIMHPISSGHAISGKRPIIVVPEFLGPKTDRTDNDAFSPAEFLGNLLALCAVFAAGYLWLLIGA